MKHNLFRKVTRVMKNFFVFCKNLYLFLHPKTDANEAVEKLLDTNKLNALTEEQEKVINQKFNETLKKHLSKSLDYSHNRG